jgi:hypothetical protein
MGEQENQEEQSKSNLSQLLATLTTDQIRFVVARQEFSSDKDAAKSIGIKPNTVSQWKHSGIPIDEAVRLMVYDGMETALHLRKRSLAKAMAVKVEGLDEKNARLRQDVATEIIEWEMGKATQHTELGGIDGKPIDIRLIGNINPDEL